jgi:hypothetical protein
MDAKIAVLSAAGSRLNSAGSQRRHPGPAICRPGWQISCCGRCVLTEIEKLPMLGWIRRWFAEASDQAIIRVVATIVGLSAYIVWGGYSYLHPDHEASVACKANCATEFSSRHRAE